MRLPGVFIKDGVSISALGNEVVDHCYSDCSLHFYSPHFVWIWQKEWQRKHIHTHAWFPVFTHRGQQSAILFEYRLVVFVGYSFMLKGMFQEKSDVLFCPPCTFCLCL